MDLVKKVKRMVRRRPVLLLVYQRQNVKKQREYRVAMKKRRVVTPFHRRAAGKLKPVRRRLVPPPKPARHLLLKVAEPYRRGVAHLAAL